MNQSLWTLTPLLLLVSIVIGCSATHRTTTRCPPSTQPISLSAHLSDAKFPSGTHPVPTLTPYPAPVPNGAAVVVIPGGGYGAVMDVHEGSDVCRWLNGLGVDAFLLRYRVAPNRYPAPLDDAQAAIRLVRSHAKDWGLDPKRVGVIGFSAGGHLAASTATLFHAAKRGAPADRPDFAILVYPVISLEPPFGHIGSRNNLLGPSPTPDLDDRLSLQKRVTSETPPCFIVQGRNDKVVDARNAESFYAALKAHGVRADLDLIDNGPHGFGLKNTQPDASPWTDQCAAFLRKLAVLPKSDNGAR